MSLSPQNLHTLESQIQSPDTSISHISTHILPSLHQLRDELRKMQKKRRISDEEMYRNEKYLRDVGALIELALERINQNQDDSLTFLVDSISRHRDESLNSGRDEMLEKPLNDEQLQMLQGYVRHHTDESLEEEDMQHLKEDVRELLQSTNTMRDAILEQEKMIELIDDKIEKATVQVEKGVLSQKNVVRGASLGLLVGGAVMGGVLGGPVGLYLGYQAAALGVGAAVGIGAGSVGGAVGGYGVGRLRSWVSGTNKKTRSEKREDELAVELEK